jgi:hypothetical protein
VSIDVYVVGRGLVVGARDRWSALPPSADVCFVDRCDLTQLRLENPTWREAALSPVDIVDESGELSIVTDKSIDYVIDWEVGLKQVDVPARLLAAARVLKPGGALLLPVRDGRYREAVISQQRCDPGGGDEAASSFRSFILDVVNAALSCEAVLTLEVLTRHGELNVAVLRRVSDLSLHAPAIVSCGSHVYLMDGLYLRHITSLGALERLRSAHLPMFEIEAAERSLFADGSPLHEGGVSALLATMGTKP